MTMGTASTMTGLAEALGMSLPGASSIPAADSNHIRMCADAGRRIVEMVWEDLTPARIQTARRSRTPSLSRWPWAARPTPSSISSPWRGARACNIGLDDFDAASRKIPVIANVRPSGDKYLMEDFYYAGGLPALMPRLKDHLHLDAFNGHGQNLGENIAGARSTTTTSSARSTIPIYAEGALAVLRGNLCARRLRHQAVRRSIRDLLQAFGAGASCSTTTRR